MNFPRNNKTFKVYFHDYIFRGDHLLAKANLIYRNLITLALIFHEKLA